MRDAISHATAGSNRQVCINVALTAHLRVVAATSVTMGSLAKGLVAAGVTMVRNPMKTVVFAKHAHLVRLEYVEHAYNAKEVKLRVTI